MNAISAALVKFQSQLRPVNKDSENPFFKSSYADLSSILQAVVPLLTANSLAVIQPMKVENGITILITKIIHSSGESIQSEMVLPVVADPQKFGSLITYYKRYQLQAILGVSTKDEDDDGNYASDKQYNQPKVSTNQPVFATTSTPASEAQKGAMRKMGIVFKETISKADASKMIEAYNKGN
jgi:hypothetical protein